MRWRLKKSSTLAEHFHTLGGFSTSKVSSELESFVFFPPVALWLFSTFLTGSLLYNYFYLFKFRMKRTFFLRIVLLIKTWSLWHCRHVKWISLNFINFCNWFSFFFVTTLNLKIRFWRKLGYHKNTNRKCLKKSKFFKFETKYIK